MPYIDTPPTRSWTFLSKHAQILVCLATEPNLRLRDMAECVGLTERGVMRIIADLDSIGAIERTREGRRNRYRIVDNFPLKHKLESHKNLGELLAAIIDRPQS